MISAQWTSQYEITQYEDCPLHCHTAIEGGIFAKQEFTKFLVSQVLIQ